MLLTSSAFCAARFVQSSKVAVRVMDLAHVYVASAVRFHFSLAFSLVCSESYQELPVDDVGVMAPYCGNGRRAFVSVVVGGKFANGSEYPAVLTAAEPICEFRRVKSAARERLRPWAARIAGVTALRGYIEP